MNRLFSPDDVSIGQIHDQIAHLAKISSDMPPAFPKYETFTREQISALVETAFWASLQSNEERTTKACSTVAAPESFQNPLVLATPVSYDESQIAKLAPAVPKGGCIGIRATDAGFNIWGFGRSRPVARFDPISVEVSEPGIVKVNVGPFQPFAVLTGRSNPVIEGSCVNLPAYLQQALRKAIPADDMIETQAVWRECLVLGYLAQMIVANGHGGAVLIVPGETGAWEASLDPFAYKFAAPDSSIRDGIRRELKSMQAQGVILQRLWQSDLADEHKHLAASMLAQRPWYDERDVRAVASLAGVDGAIVMTKDLKVLGFGAKIAVKASAAPKVCMFRPEPGSQKVDPLALESAGGTRHQSAARFAAANQEAVAIVISQDRHMSVMNWEPKFSAVQVMRNTEWWA